jgi:hypothetical protein
MDAFFKHHWGRKEPGKLGFFNQSWLPELRKSERSGTRQAEWLGAKEQDWGSEVIATAAWEVPNLGL